MPRKILRKPGDVIGTNKIIYEIPQRKNGRIYYLVECLLCHKTREVRADNLFNKCKSCAAVERNKNINFITDDLKGKQFGHWLVINKANKANYWICQDTTTGTVREVFRGNLTSGRSKGDGSVNSWGEQRIVYILNKNNIPFIKEYSFPDLIGNSLPLRFDFGLLKENCLIGVIEYQGRQHFKYNSNWNMDYNQWCILQEHDQKKKEYCSKNNIPLLLLSDNSNLEKELLNFYNTYNTTSGNN